eukprot:gene4947-5188_t
MSGGPAGSKTWRTVNTLEWKKKHKQQQKAPRQSKGFDTFLDEAQVAVAGKLSSAGGVNASYLNRLSEIQLQDEAYIHEQLGAEPEDCEHQSGGGSRRVRFRDESQNKAVAGVVKTAQGSSSSGSNPYISPGAVGLIGHKAGARRGAGRALKPSSALKGARLKAQQDADQGRSLAGIAGLRTTGRFSRDLGQADLAALQAGELATAALAVADTRQEVATSSQAHLSPQVAPPR